MLHEDGYRRGDDMKCVRMAVGAITGIGKAAVTLVVVTIAAAIGPAGSSAAAPAPVVIGHAGMLNDIVRLGLTPELAPGIAVTSVSGGSLAVARSIRDDTLKTPAPGNMPVDADIYGSADANVNQILLGDAGVNRMRWYAAFARSEIVLAYSPSPTLPRRALFDAAAAGTLDWYKALEPNPAYPDAKIGRSNPDEDPSGYYALFVMQLAERFYEKPGLKQQVLGDDLNPAQVIPAAGITMLAGGGVDAIFLYKSIAKSFGLSYVSLPPQVNLSDPAHAAGYATASYTNSIDSSVYRGGVIRPSFGPIEDAPGAAAAHDVLKHLFANRDRLNATHNFLPSELYAGGDPSAIPADLRPYFHLRRSQLTVRLLDGCSTERLHVSGEGIRVAAAERVAGLRCRVTVEAQAGATGNRDLVAQRRIRLFGRDLVIVTQRLRNAVRLADATPVKPSFLP